MKIGILVDELAPGSAPKLLGWPIRKLKEIGIAAEALVIIERPYWKRYKLLYDFHLSGVKVRYLFPEFPKFLQRSNFKFPGMSFFSFHHIMSWFFSHRAIGPKEYDLIIAHCQYSGLAARDIKRRWGIPFLLLMWDPSTFTARKIYKNRFKWRYPFLYAGAVMLDKLALKDCEAVITSGRFHHTYLRKITDKPLEVLAPGCFVKEELPDFSVREPMIITYDRWDIGNTPTIFLDILEGIERRDVTLTIGGFWHPESLRGDFQKEVARRNLEGRVELLGPFDEEMIMDLCSRATVHIHPVHEAFGMQTLEAAACGCPVIIPAGSGVAELFEHSISGYFPEKGDVDEFVYYVNKIFSDRANAEEMGRRGWAVARNYTWSNYARRLVEIIRKYI